MTTTSRYAWIPTRPAPPPTRQRYDRRGRRRDLPAADAPRDPKSTMSGRRFLNTACGRCGHAPFGYRKRCAACLGPRPEDREAGHIGGGFEQLGWLALLLVFAVGLIRVAGVYW